MESPETHETLLSVRERLEKYQDARRELREGQRQLQAAYDNEWARIKELTTRQPAEALYHWSELAFGVDSMYNELQWCARALDSEEDKELRARHQELRQWREDIVNDASIKDAFSACWLGDLQKSQEVDVSPVLAVAARARAWSVENLYRTKGNVVLMPRSLAQASKQVTDQTSVEGCKPEVIETAATLYCDGAYPNLDEALEAAKALENE